MQKFGDNEQAEVLQGRQAGVLHSYMERLGKYQVSEFADEDKEALQRELEAARALDAEDAEEYEKRRQAAEKAAATRAENQRKMEEDHKRLRAEEAKAEKVEKPSRQAKVSDDKNDERPSADAN